MAAKRRTRKPQKGYRPVFTEEEYKLMQVYGPGSLLDEIGLNRVMLLRLMHKMSQDKKKLSFRDHLDALRVVAYTTGHISRQMQVRDRLFKPYQLLEKRHQEFMEQVDTLVEDLGVQIVGVEDYEKMVSDLLFGSHKVSQNIPFGGTDE